MENKQPIEKQIKNSWGETIDVVDIWDTIQGEGPYAGTPAVFIRLAGCNLQCPLCDTDYTNNRKLLPPEEIVDKTLSFRDKGLVVLTGGEPFRQPIAPLVRGLIIAGYHVQIETNGTLYDKELPYGAITIVCSPKSPAINRRLRPHISALKYVVQAGQVDPGDGLPTMVLGMPCRAARPEGLIFSDVYVQPADEQDDVKNQLNLETAMMSCRKFGYRLCLQLHKFLGLP